ncbi:MAG: class II aldolase/adducin family protein [Sulfolobales archaeon]
MLDLEIRREIVRIMKRLYMRSLITTSSGNVSRRASDRRRFWITSSGVDKYSLKPEDLSLIDIERGERVLGSKPSSEYRMHLEIYRARDDIEAIVHAHPFYAVALSHILSRESLTRIYRRYGERLYEARSYIGSLVVIDRYEPGSVELAKAVAGELYSNRGVSVAVLRGHGAVSVGASLYEALNKIEVLEDLSRLIFYLLILRRRCRDSRASL